MRLRIIALIYDREFSFFDSDLQIRLHGRRWIESGRFSPELWSVANRRTRCLQLAPSRCEACMLSTVPFKETLKHWDPETLYLLDNFSDIFCVKFRRLSLYCSTQPCGSSKILNISTVIRLKFFKMNFFAPTLHFRYECNLSIWGPNKVPWNSYRKLYMFVKFKVSMLRRHNMCDPIRHTI